MVLLIETDSSGEVLDVQSFGSETDAVNAALDQAEQDGYLNKQEITTQELRDQLNQDGHYQDGCIRVTVYRLY